MSNKFFDIPEEKKSNEFNSFTRCCICNIPDFMALEMDEYKDKMYCELHTPVEFNKEKLYKRYVQLINNKTFID